jgi:hypothetical protein
VCFFIAFFQEKWRAKDKMLMTLSHTGAFPNPVTDVRVPLFINFRVLGFRV